MEATHLIDRLERLLTDGLHIPFTANVIVNEDECLNVVDRLRTVLQAESRKSTTSLTGGQKDDEAAVVGPVSFLPPQLEEHELIKAARAHADQIVSEAQRQAEGLKIEADHYALEELQQLQAQLETLLRRVRNGIRTIQKEGALATRRGQETQESPKG